MCVYVHVCVFVCEMLVYVGMCTCVCLCVYVILVIGVPCVSDVSRSICFILVAITKYKYVHSTCGNQIEFTLSCQQKSN
jgi:hypothetical protein